MNDTEKSFDLQEEIFAKFLGSLEDIDGGIYVKSQLKKIGLKGINVEQVIRIISTAIVESKNENP